MNATAPAQPEPPRLAVTPDPLADCRADVVGIGFTGSAGDYTVALGADVALSRHGVDVFALLDRANAEGAAGEVVRHELFDETGVELIVLVGLGSESLRDLRRAAAALARAAKGRTRLATSIPALADDDGLAAFTEGLVLGGFEFHRKSAPPEREPLDVVLTDLSRARRAEPVVRAAEARAAASWRSRTYALTPSNEKSPATLESWARDAAARAGLDVSVWTDRDLARDGFGGILAVGSGSEHESRLVRLDYTPRKRRRRAPHVVLVGKGITFDTGGISIKPRDAMMDMKRDMTGAGVVIAVMGALSELDCDVRVTGLIAAAENSVGAASMRPGDVIRHYGGRTTVVNNTDAEGRLVLADALAYSASQIKPDVLVDIATLTGAVKVALGMSMGGVYATTDELARSLVEAGQVSGEPVWRLPLEDDYESLLESPIADADNAAGGPGSITAALFLQHFTDGLPWVHLDIASVGDSPKDAFEYTQGATGFGARLLLRWLSTLA